MKGYKCDRCGEFFTDGFIAGTDSTGSQALHCPKVNTDQSWDYCAKCSKEIIGADKYNDGIIFVKVPTSKKNYKAAVIRQKLKEMDPAWKPLK